MTAYTHTTYANFRAELAARLQDSDNIFWSDDELTYHTLEVLRMWNAMVGWNRKRGRFDLDAGQTLYDLTSTLPDDDQLAMTITDQDLVAQIQYHLLEPKSPTVNAGTEMFTLAEMTAALQRRRNQFLMDTRCVMGSGTLPVPSPVIAPIELPDTIIELVRVHYRDAKGRFHPLRPESELSAQLADASWELGGGDSSTTPYGYSLAGAEPLTLRIVPAPLDSGTLYYEGVISGANLDPATGIVLGVPDDLAWALKWGALADLLRKDGPARDPARAQVCEARYQFGVVIGRAYGLMLNVQIDGRSVVPFPISDADAVYPGWQGRARSTPKDVLPIGRNLIAVRPVCDSAPHSITLDYVANASIPAADTAYLPIAREHLDTLIGYATTLAGFKMQGTEMDALGVYYGELLTLAQRYNKRLAGVTAASIMKQSSRAEETGNPALITPRVQQADE